MFRNHKTALGGADNKWYPDWNDIASRKWYKMSEQASSTGLGSIAIGNGTEAKTFYIDTIIINNESAALESQIIFTLTSTSSSPLFAIRIPMKDTVAITGLIGLNTSTATCLYYQMGNTNVMSTGGGIGGWLVESPGHI